MNKKKEEQWMSDREIEDFLWERLHVSSQNIPKYVLCYLIKEVKLLREKAAQELLDRNPDKDELLVVWAWTKELRLKKKAMEMLRLLDPEEASRWGF